MANQPHSSSQLDRTTKRREQRGVTDQRLLNRLFKIRFTRIQGAPASASEQDVAWLCAELRNAWEETERARATAAGLALEPDAATIDVGYDEWA